MKNRLFICLITMFIILFITSCAKNENISTKEELFDTQIYLLEEPNILYEIPMEEPNIWINRVGYDLKDQKKIIFKASELPKKYRIVDSDTKKVVYIGKITEESYNKKEEKYIGIGDFSEFEIEGNYYVESDMIGRSYQFTIEENLLNKEFENTLFTLRERIKLLDEEEVEETMIDEIILEISYLLLAFEIYPENFEEDSKNQIPEIIDCANEAIDYLITITEHMENIVTTRAYGFVTAYAKMSYNYQKFDEKYATELLKLATSIWNYGEKERAESLEESMSENYRILAAAELYRCTGKREYRTIVEKYVNELEDATLNSLTKEDYLAGITFISTKQKVDLEVCAKLVRALALKVGTVSKQVEEICGGKTYEKTTEFVDNMMWNVVILVVVEYIITSHEYGRLLESQYHFLLGQNCNSFLFLENDIYTNLKWSGSYIMLLSEMMIKR